MINDDNKMKPEDIALRTDILRGMVERVDTLGYKGKRREDAGLDYMCGATKALSLVNHTVANNLILLLGTLFVYRGSYTEAKRMIAEQETPTAEAI